MCDKKYPVIETRNILAYEITGCFIFRITLIIFGYKIHKARYMNNKNRKYIIDITK